MNPSPMFETKNGTPFFTSHLLQDLGIPHGFSVRYHFDDNGHRRRFNLGFTAEQSPGEAVRSRTLFCLALGLDPGRLTAGYQSHTANVEVVEEIDVGRGGMDLSSAFPATDGLLTRISGAALGVFTADCVPILLAAPAARSVAAIHAGWRGSAAGIGARAVQIMCGRLGARPDDIRAVIGPSISRDAYEVGPDVIGAFETVIPKGIEPPWRAAKTPGKWLMDLWEANRIILAGAGVAPENIEIMGLCTAGREDLFFSNRRDGGIIGSLGAFIGCAFS